jgi:pre-mRNA-splicing factor ATP-dependent RNA helicase DHX15/PRP43
MADGRTSKRSSSDADADVKHKKAKTDETDGGKKNPYLAHMYEEENGNGNGSASRNGAGDAFADFIPRQTTAKQAEDVEDLDYNAFTGKQHTKKYFDILKSRRDLPVHKQR